MPRIKTFGEFWPYYVREHASPLNRRLHFIGTSLVVLSAAAFLVTGRWWFLLLMPLSGYGFAWVGHFVVEKNRPATFQYPLYSLASDFVMYGKMWTGGMKAELRAVEKGDRDQ